jgi:hypothetical protein
VKDGGSELVLCVLNVTTVNLVTIFHIRLHTVYFKLSVYVHIISII